MAMRDVKRSSWLQISVRALRACKHEHSQQLLLFSKTPCHLRVHKARISYLRRCQDANLLCCSTVAAFRAKATPAKQARTKDCWDNDCTRQEYANKKNGT